MSVFGDIDEYGGVLFMLKIAATHKRGKYFTDKGLLGCPEVGRMATGIVAAHGKTVMEDNKIHK